MITQAERLVAEVAYKQSSTLLHAAERDQRVTCKALATLLGVDSLAISPTTPLAIPPTIPSREYFTELLSTSPTMRALRSGEEITALTLSAERSRYLPTIALVGHQQMWSSGLDKNIFPRTIDTLRRTLSRGRHCTLPIGTTHRSDLARKEPTRATNCHRQILRNTHKRSVGVSCTTNHPRPCSGAP